METRYEIIQPDRKNLIQRIEEKRPEEISPRETQQIFTKTEKENYTLEPRYKVFWI